MILVNSFTAILGIYILAAVFPAVFLIRYIYRQDKIEQEPVGLIGSLIVQGVFAAFAAIAMEFIGQLILSHTVDSDDPYYVIYLAFFVVGLAEEGAKLFFLKRRTWNEPNFDFRFDGIVYAVAVSLGFAAFENVKYVFTYGLMVAPVRAVLAIPGHMSFAVYMGYFYGRARLKANYGNESGAKLSLFLSLATAVFFHGFYDAVAMIGTGGAQTVFFIFVAVMFLSVFALVRKESREDEPIY